MGFFSKDSEIKKLVKAGNHDELIKRRLKGEQVVFEIMSLLEDKDAEVREKAAQALRRIGTKGRTNDSQVPEHQAKPDNVINGDIPKAGLRESLREEENRVQPSDIEEIHKGPKVNGPGLRERLHYKCPECGAEMEKGYVLYNQWLRWAINKDQGKWFSITAEPLTPPGSEFSFYTPRCEGFRCRDCKLVIFREWQKSQYEEMMDKIIEQHQEPGTSKRFPERWF